MNSFFERLRNAIPSQSDAPEDRFFKLFVYGLVGIALLSLVAGLTTFFLSLQGAEVTMVPDIRSVELPEAIIQLQDKQLNARVQLRNYADPTLKGKVISQDPSPGTLVRAGRDVRLTVSSGAVVDKVENFIGQQLSEVRLHLQTLFSTASRPLLQIGDVSYVFDSSDPGTILQQDPKADASLSQPTSLKLVVSRGPDVKRIALPTFTGSGWQSVLDQLTAQNIPFTFKVSDAQADQPSGSVIAQDPAAGTDVPVGTRVTVTMTRPKTVPKGKVFGLLERTLPNYAVPVELSLESVAPDGQRKVLLTTMSPGGPVGIPYIQDENTTLILYSYKSEILRVVVRPQQ
ncbi:MAG TPA: PASTA domain-containing protein [Spirochaetia bacterium]|nr:PASTA domain-containing protein [Spirochaetia bacterium]